MSEAVEVGIVAAMEREIKPLIAGWSKEVLAERGRQHKFSRKGKAVVVCSGPTKASAAASTKVLVERYAPRVLLSVGFAGSLSSDLKVPALVIPERVVDDSAAKSFRTMAGSGTVVTVARVAGRNEKAKLAPRWTAIAVDMESAAVAEIAQQHGIDFAAVKVISDDSDAELDFLGKFVTPEGFRTAAFLMYVVLRPALWPVVKQLQSNGERTTRVLCETLKRVLEHKEGIRGALAGLARDHAELRA